MNSLSDLNNFASQGFLYTDFRPTKLTFTTVSNSSVTAQEGSTITLPVGADITSIVSAANVQYSIDVSAIPGSTVTWNTLPAGITSQQSGTTWTLGNIVGVSQWQAVRSAQVQLARDWTANAAIVSRVTYPDATGQSNVTVWNSQISIVPVPIMSTPSTYTFDRDQLTTVSGVPQIVDVQPDGVYTMTITPNTASSVTSLTSAWSNVATITANTVTRSLTVTGPRANINTVLNHIDLKPVTGFNNSAIALTYRLVNPVSAAVTTRNQVLVSSNLVPNLSNVTANRYYTSNSIGLLFPNTVPQVTTINASAYRVELTLGSNIGFVTPGTVFGSTANWYTGNLTYVVSGTVSTVNSALGNLYFVPYANVSDSVSLQFRQYENGYFEGNATVNFIGIANATAVPLPNSGNAIVYTSGTTNLSLTAQQLNFLKCEALLVGGGGGGSSSRYYVTYNAWNEQGAGGGAGGIYHWADYQTVLNQAQTSVTASTTYAITVGGAGSVGQTGGNTRISAGGTTLTLCQGGGAGASGATSSSGTGYPAPTTYKPAGTASGAAGGSGGGGAGAPFATTTTGGSSQSGYGNPGGGGRSNTVGGGGGGAGGAGYSGEVIFNGSGLGRGGDGLQFDISGATVTYAQGGYGGNQHMADTTHAWGWGGDAGNPGQRGTVILKFSH